MLSNATRDYIFKLIGEAHGSYQCPLIWDARLNEFLLDESRKFRIFSSLVFLLDVIAIFILLILIYVNEALGISSLHFTTVLRYALAAMIMDVVYDVIRLRHGKEVQVLVNTFLKLGSSGSGSKFINFNIYYVLYTIINKSNPVLLRRRRCPVRSSTVA